MASIPISTKHGVNPSCAICFFCGEAKEIVLFGRLKGDVEAPPEVLMDYEPCDKCKELFKQGSLLLEVDVKPTSNNQPAIQQEKDQKLYPTGRYNLIKKEACERIFGKIFEKALIDVPTWNMLFVNPNQEESANEEKVETSISDGDEEIIVTEKEDGEKKDENSC